MLPVSPAPQRKMNKRCNATSSGQNIKVFVRVRPMNEGEKHSKAYSSVQCPSSKEIIVQERPLDKYTKKFSFDKVFDEKSKQGDIYKAVAKPLVDEVLNGFNCTIFAYGQTGTGKTFTMEGDHFQATGSCDENVSGAGIIPRCVNQLFDELRIQKLEFTMRVSFLELYNEELFDLLSAHDDLTKLRLYEDPSRKGSCVTHGLEEVLVRSKSDVYNIIEKGSAKRQTAATLMNAHSSRSHTVFTVTVHIKENTLDGDELLKTGKLHLVDLAGSENIGRSGAVDKRAREAGNINQSLLTLGRVITSLVEKAPHVPYRESKLTRLLQDALGGRTKTSIIATISSASINLEETLSTLDYAHRAKNIQNKPEVNQKLNKKELICEYTIEIDKLRKDLLAMREKNGVYLAHENYQEIQSTMEQQAQEITEKIAQIRTLEEELEKQIEMFSETKVQLNVVNEKLVDTESKFLKTKEVLQCTQQLLTKTANERDEQKQVVAAHVKTETELHTQGKNLINVADTTVTDISKLHDKLDRKRKVECMNEEVGKSFEREYEELMSALHASINSFQNYHQKNHAIATEIFGNHKTIFQSGIDSLLDKSGGLKSVVLDSLENCKVFFKQKIDEQENATNEVLSLLTSKGDSERTHILKFIDEVYHPLIKQIEGHLHGQSRSLLCFQTNMQNEVIKSSEFCNSIHEKESRILTSMQCRLAELMQYPSILSKELKIKSKLMEENAKNHARKLKVLYQQALTEIEEHENIWSSQFPILTPTQEELLHDAELSSQELYENAESLSELSSERKSQSTLQNEEINSILLQHVSETKENMGILGKDILQLENEMDEKLHETCDVITTLSSLTGDLKENNQRETAIYKAEFENKIKEFTSSITTDIELNKDDLLKMNKETDEILSDVQGKLARWESELEEFLVDHDDQLKECGDSVHALFDKQIVKDLPTGNTPHRKEYPYSSLLSATSPHERIINRLRIKANCGSKIPLPNFNNDVEDELTTYSCPSSATTSCDSSLLENENNSSEPSQHEFARPRSQTASVCDNEKFAFVKPPARQESREDLSKGSISRSSSTSSLTDSKENLNIKARRTTSTKKREIKPPSTTGFTEDTIITEGSSRARKVLGPFN